MLSLKQEKVENQKVVLLFNLCYAAQIYRMFVWDIGGGQFRIGQKNWVFCNDNVLSVSKSSAKVKFMGNPSS